MKLKRFMPVFLIVLLSTFVLFAAGQQEASKKIKLTYWSAANNTFYEVGKDAAAEFSARNPDIEISVTAATREEEILMSAVAGGVAPDLYGQFSSERAPQYMRYNAIAPLSDIPGFKEIFEARVPAKFREEYTMDDGKVYIFPYNASPVLLVYNKDMFIEAGLVDANGEATPPKTWAEYREYARIMTKDLNGDGKADQWGSWIGLGVRAPWRHLDFYPWYLTKTGGQQMYGKNGEPLFNSKDGIETMKFMLDLYTNGWTKRDPEGYAAFPQGNIGMIFGGGWLISSLPESFNYGIAPIPVYNEGDQFYTFLDAKDIGILAQSKNKDEAFAFTSFLVSHEKDLKMFQETLQVPFRMGIEEDPEFIALINSIPHVDEYLKALPYSVNLPWLADYSFYQQAFNDAYSAIIESEGRVSIESAFASAAQKIQGK